MCQSYLLLFVYQSQSPLNGELQTAIETVCPSLPALIFQVWMHAVVVLFVWEQSSTVSSRVSWLCIVLPQTRNAPARHTSCVRVCGLCDSCPAVAEARWRLGSRGSRLNLQSIYFWVRALCCSYLPPPRRRLMLLALLWMNWVLALTIFCIFLKKHICSSIPATLDPLQFAYRPNRSTDDAISQVLHSSLTHIDSKNGNYVRLLFIDYSSAFNTIVPTKLAVKLSDLGLNTSLCDWIRDFLTARPQVVKVGQFTSNSITLNIGAPQGCVLSPLLYSLYTHDCMSSHSSTSIVKFADDTVVLGLINNDDEAAYLD